MINEGDSLNKQNQLVKCQLVFVLTQESTLFRELF